MTRIDLESLSLAELTALREALSVAPGQRSRETKLAIRLRDNLIREYSQRFLPRITRNRQAAIIANDLLRYETAGWQRARSEAECPHHDARRALLWRILKARPSPPKARTIYEVLKFAGGP
ncbi:hypothetical protein ACQR09_22990 [Bradyrhizobium oligotrophicum]|uniref:hypothetical protein n=1 Tax=Bradyrhizobium oligotrophicum TaxID=44255 RepID=UPI003EBF08EC